MRYEIGQAFCFKPLNNDGNLILKRLSYFYEIYLFTKKELLLGFLYFMESRLRKLLILHGNIFSVLIVVSVCHQQALLSDREESCRGCGICNVKRCKKVV